MWHLLFLPLSFFAYFCCMPSESFFIEVGEEKLHYLRFGSGRRLLLAFHGYGEEAGTFWQFGKILADEYKTLAFDLPWHGKSKWGKTAFFTNEALLKMVQQLMVTNKVQSVSLIGYSMGGRVCLSILSCMPEAIDKVTLMAPDGLRIDKYYHFCTHNTIGKFLFRSFLKFPAPWFFLITLIKNVKLLDASRYKFVMHYLGTEAARLQLGRVWPVMSCIDPDKDIRKKISQHQIPINIFMGRYDKVMPPKLATDFAKGIEEQVKIHILEKGHRLVTSDYVPQIAATLL